MYCPICEKKYADRKAQEAFRMWRGATICGRCYEALQTIDRSDQIDKMSLEDCALIDAATRRVVVWLSREKTKQQQLTKETRLESAAYLQKVLGSNES